LKIKVRQTMECVIIGYTRGQGERSGTFGALHLAQSRDGELAYVGKVGTGFDDRGMKALARSLEGQEKGPRPVPEKPLDDARSIWLKPKLLCEVEFASRTRDGILREPVFLRMRPDLTL
jgi:bifunctional non-homologous end joining protein LigD